jgi:hypothetical protein
MCLKSYNLIFAAVKDQFYFCAKSTKFNKVRVP